MGLGIVQHKLWQVRDRIPQAIALGGCSLIRRHRILQIERTDTQPTQRRQVRADAQRITQIAGQRANVRALAAAHAKAHLGQGAGRIVGRAQAKRHDVDRCDVYGAGLLRRGCFDGGIGVGFIRRLRRACVVVRAVVRSWADGSTRARSAGLCIQPFSVELQR